MHLSSKSPRCIVIHLLPDLAFFASRTAINMMLFASRIVSKISARPKTARLSFAFRHYLLKLLLLSIRW